MRLRVKCDPKYGVTLGRRQRAITQREGGGMMRIFAKLMEIFIDESTPRHCFNALLQ